jgi:2-methylcitrate dehydratase PrpD
MRITEEVAGFVAVARYNDFPSEALHIAKRCIIDGLGVILAGSAEPAARIVRDYAVSVEGRRESTILGREATRVPAPLAALANGTSGHAMDWDDTALSKNPDRTTLLHPTMPPLVAALASAEKMRVTGEKLLTAFLVGFEVECKIAEAILAEHWVRGFHPTNTCGIFGATSAVANLMGLSIQQVQSAFGLTASMASGLGVNLGTMGKPLHVGRAAENGIVAAQLSASGFYADPHALEGPRGFFQAFAGGFDPNKISGRLGNPFSIIEPGVSIKPYPCGVVGHPAMDAMRALVIQHDLHPDAVSHVRVATGSNVLPPRGPFRYKKAHTALEAKFCLPFQMVCMILRRQAGIAEFTDEFVQSPSVQEMMERVEAVIDPEIDALGRDKLISVIEILLKDGRILKGRSAEKYRGGPDNPLSREELAQKFRDCARGVLSQKRAMEVMEMIECLEDLDNVRRLIEAVTVPRFAEGGVPN